MDLRFRSHAKQMFGATAIILITSLSHVSFAWPQDLKELSFATDPTYPPFEFSKDGVLVGFDIDLLAAIGKAAGFKAKLESVPFDGIIPALKAGTYDGAMAAMSANEERAKSIAFSKPYFKTGLVIVVPSNDNSILREEDLKGKRIAVEIGSVGATRAATIPDAHISTFNTPNSLLELATGNVDAAIGDASQVNYAVATGEVRGVKVIPGLISTDFYVIGLPKESKNESLINSGLVKVIDSGEYARIYKKWFGEDPMKF
ncbi:basic amino acid ABC transporter substrate-binding protein [Mesorhizobium sp. M0915]|uniref:basic amino acid ABC transporter substrate-binding protein n=1 Tax=Mesorhizobium sp. M0915 TaxID=2957027 RepID=UPI00333B4A8D